MKTKQIIKGTLLIGTLAVFSGCATTSYNSVAELNKNITHKDNKCVQPDINKSAWYVGNLYDCKTKSWFIPYELWSGASFDGSKSNSINHQVNTSTDFSYREDKPNKMRTVTIKGALSFIDIPTDTHHKIYKRSEHKRDYIKNEYFLFSKHGIGRVYDDKGHIYGGKKERHFSGEHIKFPAGYGWTINKPKSVHGFVNNVPRTTTITIKSFEINDKKELEGITFIWELDTKNPETIKYKYTRNKGINYQYGGK